MTVFGSTFSLHMSRGLLTSDAYMQPTQNLPPAWEMDCGDLVYIRLNLKKTHDPYAVY